MIRKAALLLTCLAVPALAQDDISGRYTVTGGLQGTFSYDVLELKQSGDTLSGTFGSDPLRGTRHGNAIEFTSRNAKNHNGDSVRLTIKGRSLVGEGNAFDETAHNTRYSTYTVIAEPVAARPAPAPRRHEFVPTQFYRAFSPTTKPVLTIADGDTVHTTTIDAGGIDEKGVGRSPGGNPQTGPFYVEGAMPGDTLAIHIMRLRLNRSWADSDDRLVRSAVNTNLAIVMKDTGKQVFWHLDPDKGIATPEKSGAHMKNYAVPLRPMLGCVAVAPNELSPPGVGDAGYYGGNMDFNGITEGATVYLQVRVPGALLYVGDGHAVMGDGELTGNALETSMDVEFRVEVISGKGIASPRVENATQIMALGYEGSVDEALKTATFNMSRWLIRDYGLDASEVAQVLGSAAQIRISEVAGDKAGVAMTLDKSVLATLVK
jgi:acetamidase/formamidase